MEEPRGTEDMDDREAPVDMDEKDGFGAGVTFFGNAIVRVLAAGAAFCNVAAWGVLWAAVSSSREIVILHYNVYLGVDMTGSYPQIFLVPSVGLLFLAVNGFLAKFLYESKERVAAYMLLLAGFMIEFGVLIASVSVALINY